MSRTTRLHRTSRGNMSGFTVIELLVVISIISLLMAILLPSLQQARTLSRTVRCLANVKQLGAMLEYYMNDYKDYVPPHTYNWNMVPGLDGPSDLYGSSHISWMTRIVYAHYLDPLPTNTSQRIKLPLDDIRLCPELVSDLLDVSNGSNEPSAGYGHYMMATQITGYSNYNTDGPNFPHVPTQYGYAGPVRRVNLFQPSQTMTVTDGAVYTAGSPFPLIYSSDVDIYPTYRWWIGSNSEGQLPWLTPTRPPTYRHKMNSVNFAFFDGHAETRARTGDPNAVGGALANSSIGFGVLLRQVGGYAYDNN